MRNGRFDRARASLLLQAAFVALLAACEGGADALAITAPESVIAGQAGYAATVPAEEGATYAWTIENGTIMLGESTDGVAFTPGASGSVTLRCRVTDAAGNAKSGSASCPITAATASPEEELDAALGFMGQLTTVAFAGVGLMAGNLEAQTFFPGGKLVDYFGFQYLRDVDPDDYGHTNGFQTRLAANVLYTLDDAQIEEMKALIETEVDKVDLYYWKRYPLMTAFRRLLDQDLPAGTTGLDADAVTAASKELYLLDGEMAYERAVAFSDILRSLTAAQKTYLSDNLVGKGYDSWPELDENNGMDVINERIGTGLSAAVKSAFLAYAGDLFSWYSGPLGADVYFCPERHGTYFGSFYIKDAPITGHPGASVNVQTGEVGEALCDSTLAYTAEDGTEKTGYVSEAGATKMNDAVEAEMPNLYSDAEANMVLARTTIATALRSLITSTAPTDEQLASVKATVDEWSGIYGELDGESNAHYATTFAELYNNIGGDYMTDDEKADLVYLRKQCLTYTYDDGTSEDFSVCTVFYTSDGTTDASDPDVVTYTSDELTDPLFI
jgi:hypothetical protein